MSYGCCMLMTLRMQKIFPKKITSEVAVLGSGYMGLFTAKLLAEKGYSVRLYSDLVPGEAKRGSQYIASEAAGVQSLQNWLGSMVALWL